MTRGRSGVIVTATRFARSGSAVSPAAIAGCWRGIAARQKRASRNSSSIHQYVWILPIFSHRRRFPILPERKMRLRLVQPRPVAFPSWAIVAMVGGVGRGHGRAPLFHSHARLSPHRSLSSSLAHQRWCSCLTPPVAQVPGTAVPGELRRDAPATRWRRARERVSIRSSPTAPSIRPYRCCAPQRATQERKKASPILSQMSHSYSPHISAALVLSPVDLSRARARWYYKNPTNLTDQLSMQLAIHVLPGDTSVDICYCLLSMKSSFFFPFSS